MRTLNKKFVGRCLFNKKQNESLLIRNDVLENDGPTDSRIVDQVLQRQHDLVVGEVETFRNHINDLEQKIKVLEKAYVTKVNKVPGETLTKNEIKAYKSQVLNKPESKAVKLKILMKSISKTQKPQVQKSLKPLTKDNSRPKTFKSKVNSQQHSFNLKTQMK